jgi:hypothetical protein
VKTVRSNYWRNVVGLFALVTIILCVAVFSGESKAQNPANNAEELVFSTPGFFPMTLTGNTKGSATPFGFWIWCAASPSPASGQPTYQFFNACQGSMYFYALDKHEEPVIGFATETDEGLYTMTVVQGTFAQLRTGTLNPAFICFLNNPALAHSGPTNEVDVDCTFFSSALGGGTGTAAVTNSTVVVTGP